ncbi:putative dephospho-CoA kinase [Lyophyllum shimeji]|uniref:Dephospho-CoA kinase n=1 Tax=Lyophyllum shimeji TaxID=47721 RepID=A0A9P3UHV1_LYOSH|nr:putative dephospho-CoA kinase [Lyophyllum shimeji]
MLVIGLTGGIATGKSTVSKLLKDKNVPVVDADVLARQVVQPGTPGLAKIVKEFGPEILLPDGTLDRKKLGTIVFNDEEKRKKLNAIVHPAVKRAMFMKVIGHWVNSEKYCILDVPLLIEGGLWRWVGKVVVVYCSDDIQLQRLMRRDGSTLEDASARLNSQMPITEKVAYADVVIDNSGTPQELNGQVEAFVERLDKEMGPLWWIGYILPFVSVFSAIWLLASRRLGKKRTAQKQKKS